jgi:tungstate transport system permease protein
MLGDILPIVVLSLQVAGVAVGVSSLIGLPLGTWLGIAQFPGKRIVSAVIYTGMAMPPVVIGLAVYMLLSRSGPLGGLDWLFTPKAMVLAQIVLDLPFVIGITMTAVAAVPPELYLQLRSLGATPRQARWAMLREASPGVILALATALGRSMSEVGAVWMVGGNIQGHTRVLTTAIMLETSEGHFVVALVLGSVLLTIALLVNVAIVRFQRHVLP